MRRLVHALVALAAFVALSVPARGEDKPAPPPDFPTLEKAFQADFGSKDHVRRLRAFTLLKGTNDLRAVDLVLGAVQKALAEEARVRAEQQEAQDELAKVLTEIERVQTDFEDRFGSPSEKQLKQFNAKVNAIVKRRDAAYARQKALDEDLVRARSLVASATSALGNVIQAVPAAQQTDAVGRVEAAWMAGSSSPSQRVRFVDVLASVKGPRFDERLKLLSLDDSVDPRVRVAATSARLSRRDPTLLSDAVNLLGSPAGPVHSVAIEALQTLRRIEAIEPLIEFLGREDIGRMREDAHRALRALTGQKHGPFAQPWRDWWNTAKATFTISGAPVVEEPEVETPDGGLSVGHHGILSFSHKILFVMDVSKSMEEPRDPAGKGKRAAEPKIDVAKRELLASIGMLDAKMVFNIVFFGHTVVPYQPEMLPASPLEKDRAKAFIAEMTPVGATNIHDALETAFRLAGWSDDQKSYTALVDTIFFLTDGKPTAGKVQLPERILETVREWNRTARIRIHCVGMGDHDPAFLERLAKENGGKYVRR